MWVSRHGKFHLAIIRGIHQPLSVSSLLVLVDADADVLQIVWAVVFAPHVAVVVETESHAVKHPLNKLPINLIFRNSLTPLEG